MKRRKRKKKGGVEQKTHLKQQTNNKPSQNPHSFLPEAMVVFVILLFSCVLSKILNMTLSTKLSLIHWCQMEIWEKNMPGNWLRWGFSTMKVIGIMAADLETRWISLQYLCQDIISFQKACCRLKSLYHCAYGQNGPFWLWSLWTQMLPEKHMQLLNIYRHAVLLWR